MQKAKLQFKIKNFLKFIYLPSSTIYHPGKGFTLIELVVVMAIIAILAAAGLSSFTTSQAKGRDGRRKADLTQVSRALEMYYNDYGSYPTSNNGLIVSCGVLYAEGCPWETGEFKDSKDTVYMIKLPKDPSASRQYFYWSDSTTYRLYAWLENTQDTMSPEVTTDCDSGTGTHACTYGISSSNTKP